MCADLVIRVLEGNTNLLSLGIGAIGKHIDNGLFICACGERRRRGKGRTEGGRNEEEKKGEL